eukprot:s3206_g6.t1
MSAAYFDDELSLEFIANEEVSRKGLLTVFKLLGSPPQVLKSFAPGPNRHYLGTSVHVGDASLCSSVRFQPKFLTLQKVLGILDSVLESGRLERESAGKLRGDLQWFFSMVSGQACRFAAPLLRKYPHSDCAVLDSPAISVLETLRRLVVLAEPRSIDISTNPTELMHVYTDASFEDGQLRLGWIMFSSAFARPRGGTCVVPQRAIDEWMPRDQQIFMGETLAVLLLLILFPEMFRQRDVLWFIDNVGACSAAIHATSQEDDVHEVALAASAIRAQLACRCWFEWVDSVLSVAICPQYTEAALGLRVLCSGGEEGRLVLSRRGRLETRHATLHHGEGPITAVRWRGGLVAWVNSKGVKVVDIETYQKVTYIARPSQSSLCWLSDDALLIGGDQDILLAEFHVKLGGPSGVRFARISQRFALSGDFVHSLAQLDSAQLPKPGALCEALRLWPKTTKPTKTPLMAALQRALRPGDSSESRQGLAWEPQAENCEESGASEVLASLHEARGDATSALRLLAAAGSQRVFALLRRHLGQGADLGAVSALLPRLVALHPGQMADLAAAHPESLKPAELLAALAPQGTAWELRYLRLLAGRSPEAAKHFRDRMVRLTAELRPHHFRLPSDMCMIEIRLIERHE